MLLTLSTTHTLATDLGYLLHKHPERCQSFDVSFGQAHVFYPKAFECARPQTIVVTTPNREYNVMWESLPAGNFRHLDHRVEWTRQQFQDWARRVAGQYGYTVRFVPVGPVDETVGVPTQMGVFQRERGKS